MPPSRASVTIALNAPEGRREPLKSATRLYIDLWTRLVVF
jgi:hypothetical protein